MIPRTIHQAWFGTMPSQIAAWMQTVRNHHPDWQFMLWNEQNVSELGLDIKQMKVDCGHPASFSSIVRLHAVNQHGGIFLDCDIEALKPLDPLLEYSAFCAVQDNIPSGNAPNRICSAVFGAFAGHSWLRWQIDRIKEFQSHDPVWGIHLMSQAPREGVTIFPTEYFFPYLHDAPKEKQIAHPDSYLIHRWFGSWG